MKVKLDALAKQKVPKKKRISFGIDDGVDVELKELAVVNGVSFSKVCEYVFQRGYHDLSDYVAERITQQQEQNAAQSYTQNP